EAGRLAVERQRSVEDHQRVAVEVFQLLEHRRDAEAVRIDRLGDVDDLRRLGSLQLLQVAAQAQLRGRRSVGRLGGWSAGDNHADWPPGVPNGADRLEREYAPSGRCGKPAGCVSRSAKDYNAQHGAAGTPGRITYARGLSKV